MNETGGSVQGAIGSVLGEGGAVARRLPGYELRKQQVAMAEAVADAFAQRRHLLVEAGTGVGKSFAYLVPAMQHILTRGGRVVVSTNTIALQEQLIGKDIPFLLRLFDEPISVVLVKGRANYLGLRRLARTSERQGSLFSAKGQLAQLHRIEDWAYHTRDGTLSDLPRQPDPAVWDRVRSDADDCLGRKCPHFERCFYQRARRRAASAQLLIVNHALLFSDLAVKERGGSILPSYDYLILDEAHTVERVAADHFGFSLSSAQVRFLLNRLYNERTKRGVLVRWKGEAAFPTVSETRRTADSFFAALPDRLNVEPGRSRRLRE
ncbi:MAG: DEAD/DEAH box helicase, partial [Planctomycetota bacterium]